MDKLAFEVVPSGRDWAFSENGVVGTGRYATREAAFEVIAGAVSNALKEGAEVSILIRAVVGRT